jgi:hypothetical protein
MGKIGQAHRFSYAAFVGPIPDGLHCLHHCDIKHCINPQHLYPGTDQDNMDAMYVRGRDYHPAGQDSGPAVLSDEEAAEVKWLVTEGRWLSQQQIADLYRIDQSQVSRIKRGKSFRDVKPKEPSSLRMPPSTTGFKRRF